MVDVCLLYPREKLEAAVRLAEAIEAAGYSVERQTLADGGAFPPLPGKECEAQVLLLVWSRGLVTAAMAGGLAEARRRPNLIEVSVDGIEPGVAGEVSPVVLLSGWRGQPFHLGWQRIIAEIKRLSGPRQLPKKTGAAVQADAAGRGPPGPAPRPAARRTGVRAAVTAGALLVATLGAAAALDWGPDARPDAGARLATAPAASLPPASAPLPPVEGSPIPIRAEVGTSASDSSPAEEEPSAPVRTVARAPASDVSPARADSSGISSGRKPAAATAEPRRKAGAQVAGPKRLARASEPAVKRYSRKHSKTMRLFCQRSGRSTPQCRTFARSVRDQRG